MAGAGSWLWVLVPLILIAGIGSILWPRAGLLLLVPLIFLRIELPGTVGYYPADAFAFVIIAGAIVRLLTTGGQSLRRNPLLVPIAVALAFFALSVLQVYALDKGVLRWIRQFQMFGLILAIPVFCDRRDIARVLRVVLLTSFAFVVPNIIEFVRIGGSERVFGIAYAFFPFFLVMGIFQSLAGFLMAPSAAGRLGWLVMGGVLSLGVIASQTREAMLQIALGSIVMGLLIWVWAGRNHRQDLRRRLVWVSAVGILLALAFVFVKSGPFAASAHRVDEAIAGSSGTINLRFFLWRMGLRAFLDSPLLGIGFGQINVWHDILPFWRFEPLTAFSRTIGVHNELITYAVETGLVGVGLMFWFLYKMVRLGYPWWKNATSADELRQLLVLWIPCISLAARFCFGTQIFYSLGGVMNCLYIGLLVSHCRSKPTSGPIHDTTN